LTGRDGQVYGSSQPPLDAAIPFSLTCGRWRWASGLPREPRQTVQFDAAFDLSLVTVSRSVTV